MSRRLVAPGTINPGAGGVVIGMDPHKRSVTIDAMAADETILGGGRFATTADGHQAMRAYVAQWPARLGP